MTEDELKQLFNNEELKEFKRRFEPINYGNQSDWHEGQVQSFILYNIKNPERKKEIINKALVLFPKLLGF